MKKHTKVYLDFFGHYEFVSCEVCCRKASDIHHIKYRSRGGKDVIENLMGLCREHHLQYGDKKQYMEFLKGIHKVLKIDAGLLLDIV